MLQLKPPVNCHTIVFFIFFFSLLQMIVFVIYQGADWLCSWLSNNFFIEEYFEIPMKKMNEMKTRSLKSRRLLLLFIGVQLYISRTETIVWTNPKRLVLLMLLYWTNRICVCVCVCTQTPSDDEEPTSDACPFLCPLDCRFCFGFFSSQHPVFFFVAFTSKTECV